MILAVRSSRYDALGNLESTQEASSYASLLLPLLLNFLYAAIRFPYLYKKLQPNANSSLKAVNAKETFHAHQVSTRTPCISSKGIPSKVQNSR